jgi:hypothetical protein
MSQAGKEIRETGQSQGGWVVPAVSYVDPSRRFCAYCGRPIARRYWERRGGGETLAYCGPEHAARGDKNDISHEMHKRS